MNESSIFDPQYLAEKSQQLMTLITPLFLENLTGEKQQYREKSEGELVGTLDLKIERVFFKFLLDNFPGIPIISEEAGGLWPPSLETIWLLDPIDGTHNSLAGIPLFGSMLALIRDQKVVFSAIFLPLERILGRSGLYVAGRGWGAWEWSSSPRRLAVSRQNELSDSFLLLEGPRSPYLMQSKKIRRVTVKRSRINLSCAWSMTRLASGELYPLSTDIIISNGDKPWDTLPGCLLVEEAGGRVTDFEGNPWSIENCRNLVFSNGILHEQTLSLLRKEDSE